MPSLAKYRVQPTRPRRLLLDSSYFRADYCARRGQRPIIHARALRAVGMPLGARYPTADGAIRAMLRPIPRWGFCRLGQIRHLTRLGLACHTSTVAHFILLPLHLVMNAPRAGNALPLPKWGESLITRPTLVLLPAQIEEAAVVAY